PDLATDRDARVVDGRVGGDPRSDLGLDAGAAFERVDRRRVLCAELLLDVSQAQLDTLPARGDQVDEQPEVVDARVALGGEISLQPLQAPDHLVRKAAKLVHTAGHRAGLRPEPFADRLADLLRERALELRGERGELLDLASRALERGIGIGHGRAAGGCTRDPLQRLGDRHLVHWRRRYRAHRMKSSELEYDLPPELIAHQPAP